MYVVRFIIYNTYIIIYNNTNTSFVRFKASNLRKVIFFQQASYIFLLIGGYKVSLPLIGCHSDVELHWQIKLKTNTSELPAGSSQSKYFSI